MNSIKLAEQYRTVPSGHVRFILFNPKTGEVRRVVERNNLVLFSGADILARLLSGVKAKINIIPLNAAAGIPFERPSDETIDRFARILSERGALVSVRKSRGRDIRAACGQLIVEGRRQSPAQRLAVAAFGG